MCFACAWVRTAEYRQRKYRARVFVCRGCVCVGECVFVNVSL